MNPSERRRHGRTQVSLPASLEKGGVKTPGVMRDVSIGGAFLSTSGSFAYGDAVIVHVHLPGLDSEIAVPSTIRWIDTDGCGVQFGVMGVRETHALVELAKRS
ncbi:MAG: PilZ domain-containing protein [Polyangiaceae bacterium]